MSTTASQRTLSEFVQQEPDAHPELRWRLRIRARDVGRERFWEIHDKRAYECPSCGRDGAEVGEAWEVHHKDRDWLNNHLFNLVALCHTCHRHTHSSVNRMRGLEEWKDDFLALGEGGV